MLQGTRGRKADVRELGPGTQQGNTTYLWYRTNPAFRTKLSKQETVRLLIYNRTF